MSKWLTIVEAASKLGVHERTLKRYIREKRITAFKPAGRFLIDEKDLEKFIRSYRAS